MKQLFILLVSLLFAFCQPSYAYKPNLTEIHCIADNIYFESRGEGYEGWVAVTNVVRNRMLDDRYPKSYCGVIKQKRNGICQFSWYCHAPYRNSTSHRKSEIYSDIMVFAANYYHDPERFGDYTNGALFYHSGKVKRTKLGNLKLDKPVQIGNHYFYKLK